MQKDVSHRQSDHDECDLNSVSCFSRLSNKRAMADPIDKYEKDRQEAGFTTGVRPLFQHGH